jgi:hypothetical protein
MWSRATQRNDTMQLHGFSSLYTVADFRQRQNAHAFITKPARRHTTVPTVSAPRLRASPNHLIEKAAEITAITATIQKTLRAN